LITTILNESQWDSAKMSKPELIYERVDNTVYVRSAGDTKRKIHRVLSNELPVSILVDICNTAKTNITLQDQLDKLLACYYMIKDKNDSSRH
jgi:hypothetical protein